MNGSQGFMLALARYRSGFAGAWRTTSGLALLAALGLLGVTQIGPGFARRVARGPALAGAAAGGVLPARRPSLPLLATLRLFDIAEISPGTFLRVAAGRRSRSCA